MKKALLLLFVLFVFSCCQKKEEETKVCKPEKKEKKFEMYTMSEMAVLMEQMYVENDRVKAKINKGEPIGDFPEYYNKIHSAKFTDESENDAFFKEKAELFLKVQKQLYSDKNPANAKTNFNNGVAACIACHESKCGGPIPKIKKLYIK